MVKIIVLLGCSSSGKSTLSKYLVNSGIVDEEIIGVTDRDIRENEIDGNPYWFISKKEFNDKVENNEFIEYVRFTIINNVYSYGTLISSIDFNSNKTYVIPMDVFRYMKLLEWFKINKKPYEYKIKTVYLNTPPRLRLLRSLNREKELSTAQCSEICRRFLADIKETEIHKNECDLIIESTESNLDNNLIKIKELLEEM